MKYEELKVSFHHFSKCDETYVTIPRDYLLTLIGEGTVNSFAQISSDILAEV